MKEYNYKEIFNLWTNLLIENKENTDIILNNFNEKINELEYKAPKYLNFIFFTNKFIEFFNSIKNDKNLISFELVLKVINFNKENKIINLVLKSFINAFKVYILSLKNNINESLGKKIIENFNLITNEYKLEFIKLIKINFNTSNDIKITFIKVINNQINQKNYKNAIKLILKLDINEIWEKNKPIENINKDLLIFLFKKIDLEFLVKIFENNKDIIFTIINLNNNYKIHSKIIIDLIKKFGFDINEYPELIKFKKISFYNSILKNFGFEKLEDYLIGKLEDIDLVLDLFEKEEKYFKYTKYLKIKYLNENDIKLKHIENYNNIIFNNDYFGPIEYLMNNKSKDDYLNLESFNIKEEDIIFIDDKTNKIIFNKMESDVLNSKILGIDSEFYSEIYHVTDSKISIIQIATENKIYILDIIKLIENKDIFNFLKKIFENPNIIKLGHTFSSDIKVISQTFQEKIKFNSIINLNFMVKNYLEKIGLKSLVNHFLKKQFCKFFQQSNWQKRPLLKSQLHYGALDAYVLIILYNKIINDKTLKEIKNNRNLENNIKKNKDMVLNEISNNFDYTFDQFEIIQIVNYYKNFTSFYNKNPIFLFDKKLKCLSKNLRKFGIDNKYVENKNWKEIIKIAEFEKRIIITRDNDDLINENKHCWWYNLKKVKVIDQIREIINKFDLKINKEDIFNKICFVCNNKNFNEMNYEQVKKKKIDYKKLDPNLKDFKFWECIKCNQVWWNGENYKKSLKIFNDI